jgi:hypothetical protein
MTIKEEFMNILNDLENTSPIRFYDNIQLNNLAMNSRIGKKYNNTVSWDLFIPNIKKPYTILNTDISSKPGEHWVSVYQNKNILYIYDSFARDTILKQFVIKMKIMGYKVVFVNKGKDQSNTSLNCGLYSLLFLIFVDKYGIQKARHI